MHMTNHGMTFNITESDWRNIRLAERVGISHLSITYPQGINCTLKKTRVSKAVTHCENVTVPVCKTVQKVKLNNVTEDCNKQKDYCQYNFRTQELTRQNVVCERSTKQICSSQCFSPACKDDDSCSAQSCPSYCERNSIVVCSTEPQKVVVTEKRQVCGEDKQLVTTKICFTYPDASWFCRSLLYLPFFNSILYMLYLTLFPTGVRGLFVPAGVLNRPCFQTDVYR
jgi:hypothetical protein